MAILKTAAALCFAGILAVAILAGKPTLGGSTFVLKRSFYVSVSAITGALLVLLLLCTAHYGAKVWLSRQQQRLWTARRRAMAARGHALATLGATMLATGFAIAALHAASAGATCSPGAVQAVLMLLHWTSYNTLILIAMVGALLLAGCVIAASVSLAHCEQSCLGCLVHAALPPTVCRVYGSGTAAVPYRHTHEALACAETRTLPSVRGHAASCTRMGCMACRWTHVHLHA